MNKKIKVGDCVTLIEDKKNLGVVVNIRENKEIDVHWYTYSINRKVNRLQDRGIYLESQLKLKG